MGIFMFHRPEMPRFNYIPRYYDPNKEELEKRKAAMGLDSQLSDNEKFRMRMKTRWGRINEDGRAKKSRSSLKPMRIVLFFGIAAFFIYFIFFTPLVENFITMFLHLGGK